MAKPFDFGTVINPLAVRQGLLELRGHRVPLPGIVSYEALLRGSDHHAWFEKLVAYNIRHLLVPLDTPEEDTCLFARRHPRWAIDSVESSAAMPAVDAASASSKRRKRGGTALFGGAIYDLEHRDEGFFARLKFLLESAEAAGVMVGLLLFNVSPEGGGPFRRGGNLQNLAWEDLIQRPDSPDWETVERLLRQAAEWIASAVRGHPGVWIGAARGRPPRGLETHIAALTGRLSTAMGQMLARPGDEKSSPRKGPWVAGAPGWSHALLDPTQAPAPEHEAARSRLAPFDIKCGPGPEFEAAAELGEYLAGQNHALDFDVRRPCIYCLHEAAHTRHAPGIAPEDAWRCMARGYPPMFAASPQKGARRRRCAWLSQLCVFYKQWVGKGYLRPCPEILAAMPQESLDRGPLHAAADGCGRFFVYFDPGWLAPPPHKERRSASAAHTSSASGPPGIRLALLPGAYRYFWFDPRRGKGLDHGDGIVGGSQVVIPGLETTRDAMLILESEELPDPLSVW